MKTFPLKHHIARFSYTVGATCHRTVDWIVLLFPHYATHWGYDVIDLIAPATSLSTYEKYIYFNLPSKYVSIALSIRRNDFKFYEYGVVIIVRNAGVIVKFPFHYAILLFLRPFRSFEYSTLHSTRVQCAWRVTSHFSSPIRTDWPLIHVFV